MDRTDAIRARDHQPIIARLRPHVDRSLRSAASAHAN